MIVNGIDIIGYDWVKFVNSTKVYHEIDGRDIILYGTNSNDFSYLFNIVKSVPIEDSEYIDVTPGAISIFGSVSVQSNSVDPVLLNIILTDTEETKVMVSNQSVTIVVYQSDVDTINLGEISETRKITYKLKIHNRKVNRIAFEIITAIIHNVK